MRFGLSSLRDAQNAMRFCIDVIFKDEAILTSHPPWVWRAFTLDFTGGEPEQLAKKTLGLLKSIRRLQPFKDCLFSYRERAIMDGTQRLHDCLKTLNLLKKTWVRPLRTGDILWLIPSKLHKPADAG